MAFNFGSLFTALGRALPGYVEGHRQAVQDNWNDLQQYNQAQAGQLENMFTEATMPTRLYNARLTAPANTFQLLQSALNYDVNRTAQQGNLDLARLYSESAQSMGTNLIQNGGFLSPGANGSFNFAPGANQGGGGGGYGGYPWVGYPYLPPQPGAGQGQQAAGTEEDLQM